MSQQLQGFKRLPYRMKRLRQYCADMSKDSDHVEFDPNVAAALKAQGFTWSETPRSIYRVDKLYEWLYKFEPGRIPDPVCTSELSDGIALARACFSRSRTDQKLEPLPLTFETVEYLTKNPSASSGLTAWGVKKEQAMLRGYERCIQTLSGVKAPEPCLAFARTQFNEKTRLIWGYPYSMTILEGLVARPIIDRFKGSSKTPMAFGKSTHKLGSFLRTSARHKRYAYSIDMSSFDSSISKALIKIAFKILATWFDLTKIEPTTGLSYGKIWRMAENYFIHTPIVMPDQHLYVGKKHGVPSGSYFTQVIDSICNVIIAGSIASKFNMHVDKSDIFVLGDDLLLWTNRNLPLETIANYASNLFHATFNPEKCAKHLWCEPVEYLGRVWDHGIPDQNLAKVIARLVYPERHRKYLGRTREERDREAYLIFASMAANFKCANHILKVVLGQHGTRVAPTGDDIKVFGGNSRVNPDHLTGLQRYKLIYGKDKQRYEWPATVCNMWVL